jgi:hypothetical protein
MLITGTPGFQLWCSLETAQGVLQLGTVATVSAPLPLFASCARQQPIGLARVPMGLHSAGAPELIARCTSVPLDAIGCVDHRADG